MTQKPIHLCIEDYFRSKPIHMHDKKIQQAWQCTHIYRIHLNEDDAVLLGDAKAPRGELYMDIWAGDGLITNCHLNGDDIIPHRSEFAPYAQSELIECGGIEIIEISADDVRAGRMDIPEKLSVYGSDKIIKVWQALRDVKAGETLTYKELGRQVFHSGYHARIAARAMSTNWLAIILPCHRVVHTQQTKCAYGYGPHIKKWLLGLEGTDF